MKLRIIGSAKFEDGCIQLKLPRRGGDHWYRTNAGLDVWNSQNLEPVTTVAFKPFLEDSYNSIWLFRDNLIVVETVDMSKPPTAEEIKLRIKLFLYKSQDKFSQLRKEVERFEHLEKLKPIYREQIPENVRMYVWRRDNGKCIQCGSNRNLEFDHIIPVSEGGSNTERNIQLLCAYCNKKKSNKI